MSKYKIVGVTHSSYNYRVYEHMFLFFWKEIGVVSTFKPYDGDEALILALNMVKTRTAYFEA